MRFLKFLSILFLFFSVTAQSVDERLASQFFDNGEFEKAEGLYKKIYKQNPSSIYIYQNYLNTLLALKKQKDAEKLVERQIKKFPSRMNNKVDLGYIYVQFDEKEKAEKYFDKLTKSYVNDKNSTIMIAQAFSRRQMGDRAIKTYEEASKKQGVLAFYPQLLSGYRVSNKTKDLTDLSLEVLQADRKTFDYVVRSLDVVYSDEKASDYLKQQTLLYAQKNPSNQIYDELLLEVFLQQKKYLSALRQVTSLDKRNNNKGSRVMQLADLCVKNEEYDAAIKGYQYVIDLGKNEPSYLMGQRGLIDALYLKTTNSINPNQEEVNSLVAKINDFVGANGTNHNTANSLFRLAELQVFYVKDISAGIKILESITATPRLRANFMAQCKLLLGDAYLMQNNIWDAKLMYGQVDKQFKEDALGQEAKFKNAKLSYYTGDFDWAKSQLDILKTATSQLISNNAIELALLIQDNTGLDSTEDAMKEYAQAEFYLYQNNIDKCRGILNMLPFKYPDHTLNDEIFYLKAQVQESMGNYTEANDLYRKIYENYGEDILADNALYRSANITLHVLDQPDVAQQLFEKLVLEYNSSLFVVSARKSYFGLKEGMTKEELFFNGILN
jgi:predicted Zn-dependent protease